jgi:hypothetical protein
MSFAMLEMRAHSIYSALMSPQSAAALRTANYVTRRQLECIVNGNRDPTSIDAELSYRWFIGAHEIPQSCSEGYNGKMPAWKIRFAGR